MADNTTLAPASGGDVIASKDVGGVKYPRGVAGFVAAGGTTVTDVTATAGLPVDVLDRTGRLMGHVVVDTMPTVAVTGTFFQATQPVSLAALPTLAAGTNAVGSITNTAFGATQSGAWAVAANAGTNLNTSLLALEGGGNLAAIAGKDFATQTTLTALNAKAPALGQALAAASIPIVLTAIQQAALTPPAAITGFSTDATLAALSAKVPATIGAKASAASLAVVLATDQAVLAVSGTFYQTTQPVSGTFYQTTQPVSAATLPLPTGASTDATLATLSAKVTAVNTGAVVLAAGTATIGSVFLAQSLNANGDSVRIRAISGILDDGAGNALAVATANGNASASGPNAAVAAVAGKKIRVLSYSLQAANANGSVVSASWQDDSATPVVLSQLWELAAREGISRSPSPGQYYFQSTVGQALKLTLGSALTVRWEITYLLV